jgi:hypothetical protein
VNRVVEEADGRNATLNSGDAPKPVAGDVVRICAGVVFHLDALRPLQPTKAASGKVCSTDANSCRWVLTNGLTLTRVVTESEGSSYAETEVRTKEGGWPTVLFESGALIGCHR